MPRKPLILTDQHPYHLRARSNNKEWYDLDLSDCYKCYEKTLIKTIKTFNVQIHAFVLMSNHVHMLASTPEQNISEFMHSFMTITSKGLRDRSKRINHIYGGRYKWNLIQSPVYYAHCFKYIYLNPVRAGIAETAEQYPWSTISNQKQKLQNFIQPPPHGHDLYVPINLADKKSWINERLENSLEEKIRKALKRTIFEFKPDRKTQKFDDYASSLHGICAASTKGGRHLL